jgi:putative cardiolipin synthase
VQVLYDPPEKAREKTSHRIFSALDALMSNARSEVLIENAYFVPRDHGVEVAAGLQARGVKVRVLTNSLASNDVVAVHSGYQKYRDDLLERGVEIYELRPDSAMKQHWSALSWRSRAGLHAKAMVVDRRYTVVGSYNLDPRSADINTELALLIDSPQFAEKVAEFFADGVEPENSYRVTLDRGRLRWTARDGGMLRVYTSEPEAGWRTRFTAECWASCRSTPCCDAGPWTPGPRRRYQRVSTILASAMLPLRPPCKIANGAAQPLAEAERPSPAT